MAKKKIENSNENETPEFPEVATLPPSVPSVDTVATPDDGVVSESEKQKAVVDGFYVVAVRGGDNAYIVAADSQDQAKEIAANALGAVTTPGGRGEKLDPETINVMDYVGAIGSLDRAYFVQDGVLQYGPVYSTEQYKRYMDAFRLKTLSVPEEESNS